MPQRFSNVRPRLARPFGYVRARAAAAIIPGQGIRSTDLRDHALGDNYFQGWWVLIEDGNNAGESRLVSEWDQSDARLTEAGSGWVSDGGNLPYFSLYRGVHPDVYREAFNSAASELWPTLSIVSQHDLLTHEGQVIYDVPAGVRAVEGAWLVGRPSAQEYRLNLVDNGGFEEWQSGAPVGWEVDSTTLKMAMVETSQGERQNPLVFMGQRAARVYIQGAASAAERVFHVADPISVSRGTRVAFSVWVYSRAGADPAIRAVLGETSASFASSSPHTGTGWELLTVSKVIDADRIELCGVQSTLASVGRFDMYIDEAIAVAGVESVPDGRLDDYQANVFHVQAGGEAPGTSYLHLAEPAPRHKRLRILTRSAVPTVSSDSDMTLDDSPELELLVSWTQAQLALEQSTQAVGEEDRERWFRRRANILGRVRSQLERWSGSGQRTRLRARDPYLG